VLFRSIKRSRDLSAYKNHTIDYGEPLLETWAEVHQVLAERAPAWSTTVRATAVWSRITDTIRKDIALGITGQMTAKQMIQHWKSEAERVKGEL
jgi:alpha-1,4-digalacturonate transport system substrate-binding protein